MLNCPDLWQLVWICCLPSPDPSCPDLPKLVGSPQYARVWDAMQCKQGFDACRGVINIGSPASVLTLANWWMLNRQSLVWSFLLMATCISDSCTAKKNQFKSRAGCNRHRKKCSCDQGNFAIQPGFSNKLFLRVTLENYASPQVVLRAVSSKLVS